MALQSLIDLREIALSELSERRVSTHPNPLNKFGKKCFSQADEDGLTLEILRRLNLTRDGVFAEFGVGDGMENNTLILKALGWKGFWVGAEELVFDPDSDKQRFTYLNEWITVENIAQLAQKGLTNIGSHQIDVASLDLDGNDIHFVRKLLSSGIQPKLFIVEYNAKFPPPIRWEIKYDPNHFWQGDDYFGASLASFVDLFQSHSYRLVCCNAQTGSNAFFVKSAFETLFPEIPDQVEKIFVGPNYHLPRQVGHKPSVRTISSLFAND